MDRDRLMKEPPGFRRLFLALRAVGWTFQLLARDCNCNGSVVSQVARGFNTTDLHQRIRARAAELTGLDQAWLFEPKPAQPPNGHTANSDVSSAAA